MARRRLKKHIKKKLIIIGGVISFILCTTFIMSLLFPSRQYSTKGVVLEKAIDVEVIHDYIPEGKINRPGTLKEIMWIVIHETDNTSPTADAYNHAQYLITNTQDINSWHYSVDESIIYHHMPDEEVAWHAGDQHTIDGGNMNGIGIEMCVNEGSDFEATLNNTAKLTAVLMVEYNLTIDDVRTHQSFSGKICPATILAENSWEDFLDLVMKYYNSI